MFSLFKTINNTQMRAYCSLHVSSSIRHEKRGFFLLKMGHNEGSTYDLRICLQSYCNSGCTAIPVGLCSSLIIGLSIRLPPFLRMFGRNCVRCAGWYVVAYRCKRYHAKFKRVCVRAGVAASIIGKTMVPRGQVIRTQAAKTRT